MFYSNFELVVSEIKNRHLLTRSHLLLGILQSDFPWYGIKQLPSFLLSII
jgi:hypothetical protein